MHLALLNSQKFKVLNDQQTEYLLRNFVKKSWSDISSVLGC